MTMKEIVLKILSESHPEFDFNSNGVNLIEEGILDSFDIVTLISDFEDQLGISIAGADVLPENFETVDSIISLLNKSKKTNNGYKV